MKLILMTDFVLEQRMTSEQINTASFQQIQNHIATYYDKVFTYANFLKQSLTLSMFIPCDENGNVLEEPRNDFRGLESYSKRLEAYEEAKEKILFKGFSINTLLNGETKRLVDPNGVFNIAWFSSEKGWYLSNGVEGMIVEDLIRYELDLSESAIKQINNTK